MASWSRKLLTSGNEPDNPDKDIADNPDNPDSPDKDKDKDKEKDEDPTAHAASNDVALGKEPVPFERSMRGRRIMLSQVKTLLFLNPSMAFHQSLFKLRF